MMRGGAIAGTITGSRGEPVVQAQVRALRIGTQDGRRWLEVSGGAATDDRGGYRMFNLTPGEYVVAVTPSNLGTTVERALEEAAIFDEAFGRARRGSGPLPPAVDLMPASTNLPGSMVPNYLSTYYPGVTALSGAVTITVGPDSERLGVDFSATPVRAGQVVGRIVNMPEQRVGVIKNESGTTSWTTATRLSATSQDPSDLADPGASPSADVAGENGEFRLRNFSPGRYRILAWTQTFIQSVVGRSAGPGGIPKEPVLWGHAIVDVDGPSTPQIAIVLQPARTISGRVEFDLSAAGSARQDVSVFAASRLPHPGAERPQALVDPDGRFVITDVIPGRYTLGASVFVKNAVVNGLDALDLPFEVPEDDDVANVVLTVTDRISEMSGTVTWPAGGSAADYTVIIAPVDRRYWTPGSRRIQFSRPTSTGRYVIRGLPAGNYLLAAVNDLETGGQYNPEFLAALAGAAVPVTITDGGRHAQDIRVAR
jgi:hypothetical protein